MPIAIANASFAAGLAPFMRKELQPIMDAAAANVCGVGLIVQSRAHAPFPAPPAGRAFVSIISRPTGASDLGPNGFDLDSLTEVLVRVPYIGIVATKRDWWLYEEAASVARKGHSAVLIETSRRLEEIWGLFVTSYAPGRLRETDAGEGV